MPHSDDTSIRNARFCPRSHEQPTTNEGRIQEATMKTPTIKLSKTMKNLLREENQQVVEFFLLIALISFATSLGGLGVMTRVDTAFKNIGTTFHSYIR
jgi:pilus assembly protein Flp/PilA